MPCTAQCAAEEDDSDGEDDNYYGGGFCEAEDWGPEQIEEQFLPGGGGDAVDASFASSGGGGDEQLATAGPFGTGLRRRCGAWRVDWDGCVHGIS